jgi:hypothetical protein
VVGIIAAGVTVSAQEQEEVPLYTNADLEKYGPPETPNPPSPPPASQASDGRWVFVQDHLDREYSRIATDRRLDLEESLVQPAPQPVDDGYVGYPFYGRLGLWGYGDYGYGRGRRGDRLRDDFRRYYDQRTARHGYLVPRKNAPPPRPEPIYHLYDRGHRNPGADAGRRGQSGGRVHRVAVPSRSGSPSKARAGTGTRAPSSRGTVSRGSRGRSGSSPTATTRGSSSRARTGGRGTRR